jgi:hypothetical protein
MLQASSSLSGRPEHPWRAAAPALARARTLTPAPRGGPPARAHAGRAGWSGAARR